MEPEAFMHLFLDVYLFLFYKRETFSCCLYNVRSL